MNKFLLRIMIILVDGGFIKEFQLGANSYSMKKPKGLMYNTYISHSGQPLYWWPNEIDKRPELTDANRTGINKAGKEFLTGL